MFCISCGKQIDKDDLFCIYCGEEVVAGEMTPVETDTKKEDFIPEVNTIRQENMGDKIQEKIGTQVSKAQNEMGKIKNKAEIMREKSKLSNIISDAQSKKAKILAELGLIAYEKIRTGKLQDEELSTVGKTILGFDYIIYDSSVKIDELEKSTQGIACECGTIISESTKFCTGCGNKVVIPVDNRVFTSCNTCEATIEENLNYCPCCGNKR